VMLDLRGTRDRNAKRLQATILAIADDLAAPRTGDGKQEGVLSLSFAIQIPASAGRDKNYPACHEDLFR